MSTVIDSRSSRRIRPSLTRLGMAVVALMIGLMFASPLILVIISSLKPPGEASAVPPTYLPQHLSFENFTSLNIAGAGIWQYLLNSVQVTVGTIVLTVILATLAAYGFSRWPFPGSNLLFVVILTAIMVPFQILLTPLFVVARFLHVDNSLVGLVLIYTTFQLPFSLFVMRNSFDAIPDELFEAAEVDGASEFQSLRAMLPLVRPGLATVVLFAFFAAWNEFIGALILLSDQEKFTLPIMLTTLMIGQHGAINWGLLEAGVVLTIVPSIVIFLTLQRAFVTGLTAGSGR